MQCSGIYLLISPSNQSNKLEHKGLLRQVSLVLKYFKWDENFVEELRSTVKVGIDKGGTSSISPEQSSVIESRSVHSDLMYTGPLLPVLSLLLHFK